MQRAVPHCGPRMAGHRRYHRAMTDTALLQTALTDYFAPWVQALGLRVEPQQPEGACSCACRTASNWRAAAACCAVRP